MSVTKECAELGDDVQLAESAGGKLDHQNEQPAESSEPPRCYCCNKELVTTYYAEWCRLEGRPTRCDDAWCPGRRPPQVST